MTDSASESALPLRAIFYALRERGIDLGVGEYLAALTALDAGFAANSRDELTFVCQSLWATSFQEQCRIAEVIEAVLPKRLTYDELGQFSKPPNPLGGSQQKETRSRHSRPSDLEAPKASQTDGAKPPRPVESEAPASSGTGGSSGLSLDLAGGLPPPLAATLRRWSVDASEDFDLVGTLPVTGRQMTRAWRSFRRMGRDGPPIEFDERATLRQIYEHGALVEPVLVPRRTNHARVLILEDVEGSMVPFRFVTARLMKRARQSGLARAVVRYFHDVPGPTLYEDLGRRNPLIRDEVLAPFTDAGILIYSDAGAARGHSDRVRLEKTLEAVEYLRRYSSSIAWLNPVPESRWPRSTAGAIERSADIPMLALTRAGLHRAIDVLRGMD